MVMIHVVTLRFRRRPFVKLCIQQILIAILLLFPSAVRALDFEVDGISYRTILTRDTLYAASVQVVPATYIGNIVIPATVFYEGKEYRVVKIRSKAFAKQSRLLSVTLPEGVTEIGENAFRECNHLQSVTIPRSLKTLGRYAFYECRSLTTISSLGSITTLEQATFQNCTSLGSISLPETLKELGDKAFYGCSALPYIVIPRSVEVIGALTFGSCVLLRQIDMERNIRSIGQMAFLNCASLVSVWLPDSLTTLPDNLFQECSSLTKVHLPSALHTMGHSLFNHCSSLETVTLPASLRVMGEKAFELCANLKRIEVEAGSSVYSSDRGILFSADKRKLVRCPEGFNGEYIIPTTVEVIGAHAFEGCSSLTGVIMSPATTYIGELAFAGCSSLTKLSLPAGLQRLGEGAFMHCSNIETIGMSDPGSDRNNPYFKSYTSQTGLTGNEYLGAIETRTFAGCSKLKSVIIPSSVRAIVDDAFYGCNSLVEIWARPLKPPTIYNMSGTNTLRHVNIVVMPHCAEAYNKHQNWSGCRIEELISEEEYNAFINEKRRIIAEERAEEMAKEERKQQKEEEKLERNRRKNEEAMERDLMRQEKAMRKSQERKRAEADE